jgi:hypothetical protein
VKDRRSVLAIGAFLLLGLVLLAGWGKRDNLGAWWQGRWALSGAKRTVLDPDDPVLKAKLPVPDPAAGLPPSPLNDLLKPELSPEQQTDIVGQLFLDYWTNLHSLPAGTWEETCAALSGQNQKGIAFVPKNHPALSKDAFRPRPDAPGIRLHVISSTGGAFQLTFDGPDGKPYTDDDQIRNFPPDLNF